MLNTASYDKSAVATALLRTPARYFEEIDDEVVCVRTTLFDPAKSVLTLTWIFYRRAGRDLVYIDEVTTKMRIYTLHELVRLAEQAGWVYVAAYRDLKTLEPYTPLFSGLNVVFKAQ